jgi:Cu/Zn superoxide dismutase
VPHALAQQRCGRLQHEVLEGGGHVPISRPAHEGGWRSEGHESVLENICVTKDLEATVSVLSDATTDHSPVVASVLVNRSIDRRNFKALEQPALL